MQSSRLTSCRRRGRVSLSHGPQAANPKVLNMVMHGRMVGNLVRQESFGIVPGQFPLLELANWWPVR